MLQIRKAVRGPGVADDDILVDYTGGTKVMSAALLLATAGCAFSFSHDLRQSRRLDFANRSKRFKYEPPEGGYSSNIPN